MSPHKENEFFVVKSVKADYIKPAVFGDILKVTTKLKEKKSASIIMIQEIVREEELLFKGEFKLAYLKNLKPTKIPNEFFDIIT